MLSTIRCATLNGIDAIPIYAEVDLYLGMPGETIVGLPDAVIKESKNRIKSAIKHSGYDYPLRAITVNLAPADMRKEGPLLDLPIAVGILQSSGQLPKDPESMFVGELSLDGGIKPIRGVVSIVHMAAKLGIKRVIIPMDNYGQTRIISGITIIPIANLSQLPMTYQDHYDIPENAPSDIIQSAPGGIDFSDVKGQLSAKRGMEIAAAGNHNILFIGPPGSGKTMLLKRMPTILPDLTIDEAIETHKLFSILQSTPNDFSLKRPFRHPHHTTSYAGMVGGGKYASPGEISLAHNGILFLDELPEFRRDVLEVLRQPLEDKSITVSRASFKVTYPANFIFTTAMNPCPCGYYGDTILKCNCLPLQRQKYFKRISGPILDRIDLIIHVPRLKKDDYFTSAPVSENYYTSVKMKERVLASRDRQYSRNGWIPNGVLASNQLETWCLLSKESEQFIGKAIDQGILSGRSYDKVRKVARTIADLEQRSDIQLHHVCEALQYRNLDLFWR